MLIFRNVSSAIVLLSMSCVSCYGGKLDDEIADRNQEGIAWRIKRNTARLERCPADLVVHYREKINGLIGINSVIIHSNDPLADCQAYGYAGLFNKARDNIKTCSKKSQQTPGHKRKALVLAKDTTPNDLSTKELDTSKKQKTSQSGSAREVLPGIESFFSLDRSEVEIPVFPLSLEMAPQTVNKAKGKAQQKRKMGTPTIKGGAEKKVNRVQQVANLFKEGKSVGEIAGILKIKEKSVFNLRVEAKKQGLFNGEEIKTVYTRHQVVDLTPVTITSTVPRGSEKKRVHQAAALLKEGKSVREIAEILGIVEKSVLKLRGDAKRQGLLTEEEVKAVYIKPQGADITPIKITPAIQEVADALNEGFSIEEISENRNLLSVRNLRSQAKRLGLLKNIGACYQNKVQNYTETGSKEK